VFLKVGIMKKDVVCGMQVDEETTPNSCDFSGTTFYFCSPACRAKFARSPEAYAHKGADVRQHLSAVYTPPAPDSKPR
jgi:YHS domain-containing protein